jgi:hypothetical protein
MRPFFVLILSLTAMSVVCGCAQQDPFLPDDFSLSFSWNNGSLPPQYHYDYVITIGPGPQGEFDFVPGYEDENDPNRWVVPFTVSEGQLQEIFTYFNERGFFGEKWKITGEPMVGGSSISLILTAFGLEHRVPDTNTLESEDRLRVEMVQDFIRAYVPETIWEEMQVRQQNYEAGYSD